MLCAKQRAPTFCIGPEANSNPPAAPLGRRQVLRVGGGGGGGRANYGWGFRPTIQQAGGEGGGGLIMVGGLVPRYDSGGGGRCTLQAQYERRGGGGEVA